MPSIGALLVSGLCLASLLGSVAAVPLPEDGAVDPDEAGRGPSCTVIKRKEWRELSNVQKKRYINAVKCLQDKPAIAKATIPNSVSRFDDFQGVHIQQTFSIHFVGHFLAWHRYYLAIYEKALREECNYKGAQPYWDWTLDADNLLASPLWDPVTGFGGNGVPAPADGSPFAVPGATGGGCISDGPFVDMRLHLGPGPSLAATSRCLRRSFSPWIAQTFSNAAKVNNTLAQQDFGWFSKVVEGETNFWNVGIHGGGHYSIGGEAGDLYASPGEPVFYLHHANLDRIYWQWQSMDLPARLSDISGPVGMFGPTTGPNVTLSFPIDMGPLAPSVTIQDLMDVEGNRTGTGVLCYTYR
ncbi:Di-copper centre-containing protein [Tuber magnatum]|uniref:Di-copper centre-containing protein n=1 Tax=Tuber magnatum TaxID=42249 RepID=A0A317SZI7_9PEZI|nr:Di-copper centre-containing protein [Tuber magnatum]